MVALAAGALVLLPNIAGAESAQERPRGTYEIIPPEFRQPGPDYDPPDTAYAASFIIYMNRDGGTFTPGFNDSRTNTSSVPNQTVSLPAWNVSDEGWQQVMSCVQDQFSRFDVEITDVDPGDTPHIESVVAGSPGDLGLEPNVGGVSPFTQDCSVIDNSIVYTFAEVYGTDYRTVCEVVAQEVAHSFGLDHQYLCEDPMTYLQGCGPKSFQDVDAQCGEGQPRTCACGQDTQNSVQMLTQTIGLRQDDTVAPDAGILQPADGDTVSPGFGVYPEVSDDIGIQRVDLLIDGVVEDTATSDPWTLVAPDDLAPGNYVVEVVASDGTNETSSSIAVTVGGDSGDGGGDGDGTGGGTGGGPGSNNVTGGCAAGGAGAGGSALLLLLALLGLPRRRRRTR